VIIQGIEDIAKLNTRWAKKPKENYFKPAT